MPAVNILSGNLRNYIINGNFDIAQRATSFSNPVNGAYNLDRWAFFYDGTITAFTISRQAFALGQTDVPGAVNFHRTSVTSAGSGSTVRFLRQAVEDVRLLAGKTVNLSFWAKADAARTVQVNAAQIFGTGGSPSPFVGITGAPVSLTTSWQKFDVTFNVPSIVGKTLGSNNDHFIEFQFLMPINVNMVIDLAMVMLNDGSTPAAFKLAGETHEGELALCERYFEFMRLGGRNDYASVNAASFETTHHYRTYKRRVPTVTLLNTVTNGLQSGPTAVGITTYGIQYAWVATASGVAAAHFAFSDAFIDAEL